MPNTETTSERQKREVDSRALVIVVYETRQRVANMADLSRLSPAKKKGSTWWAAKEPRLTCIPSNSFKKKSSGGPPLSLTAVARKTSTCSVRLLKPRGGGPLHHCLARMAWACPPAVSFRAGLAAPCWAIRAKHARAELGSMLIRTVLCTVYATADGPSAVCFGGRVVLRHGGDTVRSRISPEWRAFASCLPARMRWEKTLHTAG